MRTTHSIVIKWKRDETVLLVNFLDPRSRLPISYQRVWHDTQHIVGLVERSLTDLGHGPKLYLFRKALADGHGEIEIEVTDEQYKRLKASGKA